MDRALHIGITYPGYPPIPELRSARSDALKYYEKAGYDTINLDIVDGQELLISDLTLAELTQHLEQIAEDYSPGDTLLITFSGHGVQWRINNDWVEGWIMGDGMMMLHQEILSPFKNLTPDHYIIVLADCCNGGLDCNIGTSNVPQNDGRQNDDWTKELYEQQMNSVAERLPYLALEEFHPTLYWLAASFPNASASDGKPQGLSPFTEAICNAYDEDPDIDLKTLAQTFSPVESRGKGTYLRMVNDTDNFFGRHTLKWGRPGPAWSEGGCAR